MNKQDQNGLSMASLVEMEHRKIDKRNQKLAKKGPEEVAVDNSGSGSEENENHSCEDEELVISPNPSSKMQH